MPRKGMDDECEENGRQAVSVPSVRAQIQRGDVAEGSPAVRVGASGQISRQRDGQMNTTIWPPGIELSRELMTCDSEGRPMSYYVVVEK